MRLSAEFHLVTRAGGQDGCTKAPFREQETLIDTNAFQNILNWNFGGRCYTAPNICFFVSMGTTAHWFNNKTTSIL